MAVSGVDPTDGSSLGNSARAVKFTVDTDPTTTIVLVRFPADTQSPQRWETAYFKGAFADRYRLSSRDGSAFTFVRLDGWPSEPEFAIDEPEPAPSGGQAWGSIYSVDFTALPAQSLSAVGAHDIDGLTWYSKGSTVFGAGGGNAVVAGSGLFCAGAAYFTAAHQMLWLPFSQVPGFRASAPVVVLWRFAGGALTSSNYMVAGIGQAADSGSNWTSGDNAASALVRVDSGSNLVHLVNGSVPAVTPTSATPGDHVYAQTMMAAKAYLTGHQAWSGALPGDAWGLDSGLNAGLKTAALSNPGFVLTRNQGTTFATHLTHLSVLQPRI